MEVFKWLKKEWPVRTGPTYGLEMRSHPFRRFRERPNTEKSRQNPFPAQLKRFIMNAKTGLCQSRYPNDEEPPQKRAALFYGKRALAKDRLSPHIITITQAGKGCLHFSIPLRTLTAATGSDHMVYHRSLWSGQILRRKSRLENNWNGAEATKNH